MLKMMFIRVLTVNGLWKRTSSKSPLIK